MMMTKTINKVIVYYTDGTYQEIKTGSDDSSDKQNTPNVNTGPVKRPEWNQYPSQVQPNQPTWAPQYTRDTWPHPMVVTCGDTTSTYKFTSTGNFAPDNKYSITSTGNGST